MDDQIKALQEAGYTVRDKDQETSFLKNYSDTEIEKRIKSRIKEVHTSYDNDFYEVTGQRRSDDEKSYDFFKRTYTKLKDKADSADILNQQIQDLNNKMRDGAGDETLKNQIKSLEKKHQEALKTWETEKTGILNEHNKSRVGDTLTSLVDGMKFKQDIPETIRKTYVNAVKNELQSKGIIHDGVLKFKDEEGTILVDRITLTPVTAADLLKDRLAEVLDVGGKSGTGSKGSESKETGELVPPDSALISDDELTVWLLDEFAKRGITKNDARNHEDYRKTFSKYRKK